jgi:hypothetical protein
LPCRLADRVRNWAWSRERELRLSLPNQPFVTGLDQGNRSRTSEFAGRRAVGSSLNGSVRSLSSQSRFGDGGRSFFGEVEGGLSAPLILAAGWGRCFPSSDWPKPSSQCPPVSRPTCSAAYFLQIQATPVEAIYEGSACGIPPFRGTGALAGWIFLKELTSNKMAPAPFDLMFRDRPAC